MTATARDHMQTDVVTVRSSLSLDRLEEVLLRHGIQGAPVVDDGVLVGIVSRSDVVRQLKLEEERISASAYYLEPFDADLHRDEDQRRVLEAAAARLPGIRVADMMITDLVTVSPDASLADVARRMLERRVHRVLVTEGTALCGVVSTLDLVRLLAEDRATLG